MVLRKLGFVGVGEVLRIYGPERQWSICVLEGFGGIVL